MELLISEGSAALAQEKQIMSDMHAAGERLRTRLRRCERVNTLTPGVLLVDDAASLTLPVRSLLLVYDISRNLQEVHGDTAWRVRAFGVNMPLGTRAEALTKGQRGGQSMDLGAVGQLPLWYGGPSSTNLHIIHRLRDAEGAVAIDGDAASGASEDVLRIGGCGLYTGASLPAINAALERGDVREGDIKVIYGSTEIALEEQGDGLEIAEPVQQDGAPAVWPLQRDRWSMCAGAGVGDLSLCGGVAGTVDTADTSLSPQHVMWQAAFASVTTPPMTASSSQCLSPASVKSVCENVCGLVPVRVA